VLKGPKVDELKLQKHVLPINFPAELDLMLQNIRHLCENGYELTLEERKLFALVEIACQSMTNLNSNIHRYGTALMSIDYLMELHDLVESRGQNEQASQLLDYTNHMVTLCQNLADQCRSERIRSAPIAHPQLIEQQPQLSTAK